MLNQNWLILLCWGFLPALNYAGYWDFYLSSSLYSGRTKTLLVCVKNPGNYPSQLDPYSGIISTSLCNGKILDITNWAYQELKVPVYPEERIFYSIKEILKKRFPYLQLSFFIKGPAANEIRPY